MVCRKGNIAVYKRLLQPQEFAGFHGRTKDQPVIPVFIHCFDCGIVSFDNINFIGSVWMQVGSMGETDDQPSRVDPFAADGFGDACGF